MGPGVRVYLGRYNYQPIQIRVRENPLGLEPESCFSNRVKLNTSFSVNQTRWEDGNFNRENCNHKVLGWFVDKNYGLIKKQSILLAACQIDNFIRPHLANYP